MARGSPGEAVYEPEVQPEDLPRKITPHMEAVPVGQAFAEAADASYQKYKADSAAWAGDELAQLRMKAIHSLQSAKESVPAGQDPGDFNQSFLKQFDTMAGSLTQSDQVERNPYTQRMVSKGVTELRDSLDQHTLEWEAAQRVAYREDSVKNNTQAQLPLVEAHPEIGPQVGSTLTDQIDALGGDPSRRLALKREIYPQLALAEANGLTRQNPQAMLQAINDPANAPPAFRQALTGLTDQQREITLAKAKDQVAGGLSNNIVGIYRAQGPDVGTKALTAIDSSGQPDDIKALIYEKVEHGLRQWHEESRSALTPQVVALETRIASGNAGEGDKGTAWSLYQKGALDTNQLSGAIGSIERGQRQFQDDQEQLRFATNAYQQKTPLDPKDTRTKNAVDLLFTNMTQGVDPGSAGYNNAATEMVSRVGIIPASTQNWARANLTSGDPATAARAADLVARLGETNPRAELFAEDPKLKAMASTINDAVKSGTDPATAVNLARTNASLPKPALDALEERWKQNNGATQKGQPNALASLLKSDPAYKPGWFSGLPAVPPLMQGEYDQLTKDYFEHTGGNLTQARALAAQDLKRTWGVSEVNGSRELMQYAPESMFPGLTASVVRDDVAKTVQDNAEAFSKVDPSKVRLTATDRTARTGGQDWALSVPDEFGASDIVRGKDGNPLIYRLPVSGNDYAAVRARQAQADLEKARVERDLRDRATPVGP